MAAEKTIKVSDFYLKFQPRIPPRIHAHQHRRLGLAIFTLKSKLMSKGGMRIADVAFRV